MKKAGPGQQVRRGQPGSTFLI